MKDRAMLGLVRDHSVRRAILALWAEIDKLREEAGIVAVEPATPAPETVTADSAETVTVETEPAAFDWQTTNDVEALKAWALSEHGLTISYKIKKVETARDHIANFLGV